MVDKKTENASPLPTEEYAETKTGTIQVKDQVIIVRDPANGEGFPVIDCRPPLRLIINDREITAAIPVSQSDSIQWKIVESPFFDITISEDELTVWLHLHAIKRYAWRLQDMEACRHAVIAAEEDREKLLEEIQFNDIITRLEKMSVTSYLDMVAIHDELENPTWQPVIVAQGKAPSPGEDAQLEINFSQKVESRFFEVDGSIDFRNHLKIPSVKKGEVIARKIPLTEGTPGYDVYGRILKPEPVKDVTVAVTENVELMPDGRMISLIEGRPSITGTIVKTFDILTSYTVTGNVDIETGNIVFSGDVIVLGDVTDHMIIESLGNVYLHGNVYNATITATGSILARGNVTGSKLYSGYFGVTFNRLYNSSKRLHEQIGNLLAASQILLDKLKAKGQQHVLFGQIVQLLTENKFKEIFSATRELLSVISNIQHIKKEGYQKLKETCEIFLHPSKLLNNMTSSILEDFSALLKETWVDLELTQEEKAEISINQCHNSELKSNGDILIYRDGVILSDLYSAGNIVFKPLNAVCRGSRLEAEDSILARIVGGQTDTLTTLTAKNRVSVRKMYWGRICIGSYCTDIDRVVQNRTFEMKN